MPTPVAYLPDEDIEKDASALIAEYARARGAAIGPPIPIDDIVEKYLKLGIEFDDMHCQFGVPRSGREPDILGAIYFDERRVAIDESLDPDAYPAMEGRYRYTLAHEAGGHWRLHRHLFAQNPAQLSLFNGPAPPNVVCRTSQARERIEVQADLYAACLLMPRKMVFAAWDEAFPDRQQRVLRSSVPGNHRFVEIESLPHETDDMALDAFATPFARRFLVSPIAMRIRLEKLGLLHRTVPLQRLLADYQ